MAKKIKVESFKKKQEARKVIGNPAEIERLAKRGDLNGALALAQAAYAAAPNSAIANNNLGFVIAQFEGREVEAITYYERAAEIDPTDPGTRNAIMRLRYDAKTLTDEIVEDFVARFPRHTRGLIVAAAHFGSKEEFEKSEKYFQQAIAFDEKHPDAHYHYGQMLRKKRAFGAAAKQFLRAHELDRQQLRYLLELALAYSLGNEHELADKYAQKAAELAPKDYHCFTLLGQIWSKLDLDKALFYFDHAVTLNPEAEKDAAAFKALTLNTAGRMGDAEKNFRRAIELDPENAAESYMNLGNTLVAQARIAEMLKAVAESLRLKPSLHAAMSNILLYAHYTPAATREELWNIFSEYDRKFTRPLLPEKLKFNNKKDPAKKLKIGIISADLRTHSVAYFIEPLLRAHTKAEFEYFCYANNPTSDHYTEILKGFVENWRDIFKLSDDDTAQLVRDDQIDILIDLIGHTANHRLHVLARKPAPVQVEYLGFPDTTGVSAIDYRIADQFTDPPEFDKYSAEKVVRLPGGFHCYCPFTNAPGVVPLPCIKKGYLTFGSFNNYAKTSTEVAAMWVEILKNVPDSKLYLKSHGLNDITVQNSIRERFSKLGLDPERIIIETRKSTLKEHFLCYNLIDIALDTWPYNGTTTTFEALWMGAPLVSLTGETHASRVGASILCNCGLEELIAHSPREYVEKTIALANNDIERARLRTTMRERLWCSPLLSESWFVKKFEVVLRAMWREYCGEVGAATNMEKLHAAIPKYEIPEERIRDLEKSYQRINEMIERAL